MVGNDVYRAQFVQEAFQFLTQNNFDGLDLDWEYPGGFLQFQNKFDAFGLFNCGLFEITKAIEKAHHQMIKLCLPNCVRWNLFNYYILILNYLVCFDLF